MIRTTAEARSPQVLQWRQESGAARAGLAPVAGLLGLPAPRAITGPRYDLRYFSGGIGVLDRHHVAFPCDAAEVEAVVARLGLVTPEDAVADGGLPVDNNVSEALRRAAQAGVEDAVNTLSLVRDDLACTR